MKIDPKNGVDVEVFFKKLFSSEVLYAKDKSNYENSLTW